MLALTLAASPSTTVLTTLLTGGRGSNTSSSSGSIPSNLPSISFSSSSSSSSSNILFQSNDPDGKSDVKDETVDKIALEDLRTVPRYKDGQDFIKWATSLSTSVGFVQLSDLSEAKDTIL